MIGSTDIKEDRPPYVRFERKAVENSVKSKAEGHFVADDVDYVYITPAYTKEVMIHTAEKWFSKIKQKANEGRFNPAWVRRFEEQYAAWKNGQELPVEGTPIRGWNVISPAQQETLINMKILTVEDAAAMNDDAIRRCGMGGADIRNKARAMLKASGDSGKLVMENADLRARLAVAEKNVADLSLQVSDLIAVVQNKYQAPEADVRPGISAADVMPSAEDDEQSIRAQYEAKFGEPPHHRMKLETIKAKIAE